jgi:hypothetical protein
MSPLSPFELVFDGSQVHCHHPDGGGPEASAQAMAQVCQFFSSQWVTSMLD